MPGTEVSRIQSVCARCVHAIIAPTRDFNVSSGRELTVRAYDVTLRRTTVRVRMRKLQS